MDFYNVYHNMYSFKYECMFNGFILKSFTDKFCCFPIELINFINSMFIKLNNTNNLISYGENHILVFINDKLYRFQFDITTHFDGTFRSKIINIDGIKSFYCGNCHSIILTNDGLYSFGQNDYGQLGTGDFKDYNYPTKIKFNKKIIAISCGAYYTLVVTEDRKLYGFGDNEYGQLGLKNVPKSINDGNLHYEHNLKYNSYNKLTYCNIDNVLAVDCGGTHSMILTKTGLYACGTNTKGELGIGKYSAFECIPQRVLINNVRSMHCGGEFTLVHTKTKLYKFGKFETCHYDNIKQPKPNFINIENVVSIKCGENYAIIETKDGLYKLSDTIYDEYKYFVQNIDEPEIVIHKININIQDVIAFDCGIYDSLILTTNGLYILIKNKFKKLHISK